MTNITSLRTVQFNKTVIEIIKIDDQEWIASTSLSNALNYKSSKSVTDIYNNNKEEFSPSMSRVVESTTLKNAPFKTRVFSLRGCHLIAMLSRTKIAKDFRKWVLDILETYQPILNQPDKLTINPFNPHALDIVTNIQEAKLFLGEAGYGRIIQNLRMAIDNSEELVKQLLIRIFKDMEFNAYILSGKKISQYQSWEKILGSKNEWQEAADFIKQNN